MKLRDAKYGHEVGSVDSDRLVSSCGVSYGIDGYAVVDTDGNVGPIGEVVGTFDDGQFFNRSGELMAVAVDSVV